MKKYYVYSHTVIGKNLPFYIGCSTQRNTGAAYSRAYRSPFTSRKDNWQAYSSTIAYIVKIEGDFDTQEESLEYEKLLIKKFGRIDIGTGCLINKTDGGFGVVNPCKELKATMYTNRAKAIKDKDYRIHQLPYSYEVSKYTPSGEYVCTYQSVNEAARQNKTLNSDISMAVRGKKRLIAGFQWSRYKFINGIGEVREKKKVSKPLLQIDFYTGKVIREWESSIEVANSLGISRTGVNNCLRGRTKTSSGFIWKYA